MGFLYLMKGAWPFYLNWKRVRRPNLSVCLSVCQCNSETIRLTSQQIFFKALLDHPLQTFQLPISNSCPFVARFRAKGTISFH
jgi:hypothetical protein